MKLNSISTLALNTTLRNITIEKQNALNDAQVELSTGRHADMGRELGAFSSSVVSLETQLGFIDQLQVTNAFAANRLSTMQISINSMVETSNDFIGQLTAELSGALDPQLLETIGNSTLANVHSTLNVTFKGEFVFSGVNTDSKALVDYQGSDGTAAKAAVQNAFTTEFGFPVTSPLVDTITPAAMKAFIDGAFSDLFNDANWQTLWSGSSDRGMRAKISTRELVEIPTTAQAQAFRDVTAASVLIAELSAIGLNGSAMNQLAESSIGLMGESIGKMADEQARMGVVEERIENANDRMDFQKNILGNLLSGVTEVDSYEAAVRLNQISTSLEASYSATARIQSLSLLNFI